MESSLKNEVLVSQRLTSLSVDVKSLSSKISAAHKVNRLFKETTLSNKYTAALKPPTKRVIRSLGYLPSDIVFVVLTYLTVKEVCWSLIPSSRRLMHYLIRSVHYFTHLYNSSKYKYWRDQEATDESADLVVVLTPYLRQVDTDESAGLGSYSVRTFAAIAHGEKIRYECSAFLDYLGTRNDEGGKERGGGGKSASVSMSSSSRTLHVQRVVSEMRYINKHLDMLHALTLSPSSPVSDLFCQPAGATAAGAVGAAASGLLDTDRRPRNVSVLLSLINIPANHKSSSSNGGSSQDVFTGNANVICDIIANMVCWDKRRLLNDRLDPGATGAATTTIGTETREGEGEEPTEKTDVRIAACTITGQLRACGGHRILTRFLMSPAACVSIVSSAQLSTEHMRSYSSIQGGGSKEASRALCNLYSDVYPCPPPAPLPGRNSRNSRDSSHNSLPFPGDSKVSTTSTPGQQVLQCLPAVPYVLLQLFTVQQEREIMCSERTQQMQRQSQINALVSAASGFQLGKASSTNTATTAATTMTVAGLHEASTANTGTGADPEVTIAAIRGPISTAAHVPTSVVEYFYNDYDDDEEVLVSENIFLISSMAASDGTGTGAGAAVIPSPVPIVVTGAGMVANAGEREETLHIPLAPAPAPAQVQAQAQAQVPVPVKSSLPSSRTCISLGQLWHCEYYTKSGALNQSYRCYMKYTEDYGLRGYGEDDVGCFALNSSAPHVDINSDLIWLINKTYISAKDLASLSSRRAALQIFSKYGWGSRSGVDGICGDGGGMIINRPTEFEMDTACFFFNCECLIPSKQVKFNNGNAHIAHTCYWSDGLLAADAGRDGNSSKVPLPPPLLLREPTALHHTGYYGVWEAVSREKHLELQKGGVVRMIPLMLE